MVAFVMSAPRISMSSQRMKEGHGCEAPLRRPMRRPSNESTSPDTENPIALSTRDDQVEQTDQLSCSSSYSQDQDWDDDATQVTSNQVASKKCGSSSTATTARSSGTQTHVHVQEQEQEQEQKQEQEQEQEQKLPLPPRDNRGNDLYSDLQSKPGEISFDLVNKEDLEEPHLDSIMHSNASPSPVLTNERIRSFMVDFYEDFDSNFRNNANNSNETKTECLTAFFEQYYTDNYLFIRPSGNPVDQTEFVRMLVHDIVGVSVSLVSIDSIQVLPGGRAAVVVYTADQIFLYKGKPESDRTTFTSVLQMDDDLLIRIGHEHRSVGKPIPKATRWESES